jgi:hypothetical protein
MSPGREGAFGIAMSDIPIREDRCEIACSVLASSSTGRRVHRSGMIVVREETSTNGHQELSD